MKRLGQWGATLVVLGIGSFVLPMVGMQFRIFDILAPAQPGAGIGCAVVGAILLLVSFRKKATVQQPSAQQSAVASTPRQISRPAAVTPRIKEATPMTSPGNSAPSFCGSCGAALQPGEQFCGSCGAANTPEPAAVAATPPPARPQEVPPPVADSAPASIAPKKKSIFGKVALITVGVLVLGGLGWFAYSSGLLHKVAAKQPPALPKGVTGTLTEFPIDTASLNPTHPSNVTTQPLDPNHPPTLPQNSLPPGITPRVLTNHGTSITSAQYKSKPQDSPVNVHVIDVNESSADAARTMTATITSNSPGAITTGVSMLGTTGEKYSGFKIKSPQSQTYVFGKENAPVVIMIYAPDAGTIDASDRLAKSIGNGGGLNADPGVSDVMSVLPYSLPPGVELVEMRTYNVADLISPQQLMEAFGQQGGDASGYASQVQRFLPDRLVAGRYRDTAGKEFNLLVGDYGSTISAYKTWLFLRATAGLANMTSMDVHGTNGLTVAQDGQRYVLFQSGVHLAVLAGPDEQSGGRVIQLADALQF
jgi:hypothetical protein